MNESAGKKVPAWKRLGLKLARETSNSEPKSDEIGKIGGKLSSTGLSSTHETAPSSIKKRKYVTFAEATKQEDGDRTEKELRKFLASQRGGPGQFTQEEAFLFSQLKNHPANHSRAAEASSASQPPSNPKKKKKKRKRKPKQTKITSSKTTTQEASSLINTTEEPPSYLVYLRQFHTDRPNWKFKKSKEIRLIRYAFDMALIPISDEDALQAYFRDMRPGAARQRLLDSANQVIEEMADIPDLEFDHEYEDIEGERRAAEARSEALKQAIFNEKIRLREEDDEAELDTEEFQAKVLKRKRALVFRDWARKAFKTGDFHTDRLNLETNKVTKPMVEMSNEPLAPVNSVYSTVVDEQADDEDGKQVRKRRRVVVRMKKNRTGFVEDDVESVSSVDSDYVKKVEESEEEDSSSESSSEDDDDDDSDSSENESSDAVSDGDSDDVDSDEDAS